MPKLLHLSCSPRSDSVSGAGARAFIARFQQARPNWDIDVLDLWREGLPEFNSEMMAAKDAILARRTFTDAQRDAFAVIERMAVRFSLADRVLISTPMWNFGIPYKLKHYIDLINQPSLTFRFEPSRGYIPLLKDRPTVVVVASSGDFVTGMNRGRIDMATPYLRESLLFMGIRDVEFVQMGPTAGPADSVQIAREAALKRLLNIAARS